MLDPRTKLVVAFAYAGTVAFTRSPGLLLAETGALLLAVVILRAGRAFLAWLRFAGVTVLAWAFILWLADTPAGAAYGALRLFAMFAVFFLFFHTTAAEDLGNALVKMGLPYEVAFVFSAGMAFVPVLSRRAQEVMDAQRARGIPLSPGLRGLRHYPALLLPLLVQAFTLADQLAEAMEARGFGRPGRTFLREYRMGVQDWVGVLLALLLLLGAAWYRP